MFICMKTFQVITLSTCASCLKRRGSLVLAVLRLIPGVEPYSASQLPNTGAFKHQNSVCVVKAVPV